MSAAESSPKNSPDLEVKDAFIIFKAVWETLEKERGRQNMRFPKEVILLGGAPGAGKGTNTAYIQEIRDISSEPIVVSSLLDTPEMKALKASGSMVGDREVVEILFRKMLDPDYRSGAILDGFPRTTVQVECIKLLFDEMIALRREFHNTAEAVHFKQPIFHIMVLFVDEAESVARQLFRGRQIIAHNEDVRESGKGELLEERPTDTNEDLARNRYRVFKEATYDALVSLKQIFHYHFIDAQQSLEVVQDNIRQELLYQSSLELDPRTYDALRAIPLAVELTSHARRDLVQRLDSYEMESGELFHRVISHIDKKIMPIIEPHAISGRAHVNSENSLFDNPHALSMLIDIFSERGFFAAVDIHRIEVPAKFDTKTGDIECRIKKVYRITIHFEGSHIRRG